MFNKNRPLTNANISESVEGYPILNVPSTALGAGTQTLVLPQIDSINGLPMGKELFTIQVTDVTGATAPTTVAPLETVISRFILKNKSGTTLFDLQGENLDMLKWQHLKNFNGFYYSDPAPSEPTASTTYTNTYVFSLLYSISAEDMPLKPTIVLNTLASRVTSGTALASSSVAISGVADFIPHSFIRTVLKNDVFTLTGTGVQSLTSLLPKDINVVNTAWDFGADSNLSATSTFNFSLGTKQLLFNKPYSSIVDHENQIYRITNPHISGFFPLFVPRYVQDNKTNFTVDLAAESSVAGNIGNVEGYWEEGI